MVGQKGLKTHFGTLEVFHDPVLDGVVHLVAPLELFLQQDEAWRREIKREMVSQAMLEQAGEVTVQVTHPP